MQIAKVLGFFVIASTFLPLSTTAQCNDAVCQNLNNILTSASTDFRGYTRKLVRQPNLSIPGASILCHLDQWTNAVNMYTCSGMVPAMEASGWYQDALRALGLLRPSWSFQIDSRSNGHIVDGGPPGCAIGPADGPYSGDCPVHLQILNRTDGTSKVFFWMSSLSSPYLVAAPAGLATSQSAPVVANACDEMCGGLKEALEARLHSFSAIRVIGTTANAANTAVTDKLPGAQQCSVRPASAARPGNFGSQYVCYWPESSTVDAASRFRDLVTRLQVFVPSNWNAHQEDSPDPVTGADRTEWIATSPGNSQQVAVYILGRFVALHISTWDANTTSAKSQTGLNANSRSLSRDKPR
ncbi:MAG TPA: hypothetical protein VJO16_18500 [Candidatus Acidoferrum sp.]|nr:hypothetical protein [Candidatus Acidoferrum sp.]